MTELDEQGRPEPPLAADEAATLVGFLDYLRATLAWKVDGVDAAGLRTTVGPSDMTLGGLLKHLSYVEDEWFSRFLHGHERRPLGHGGLGRRPRLGLALGRRRHPGAAAARMWQAAVDRSRACWRDALAAATWTSRPGGPGRTGGPPACAGS